MEEMSEEKDLIKALTASVAKMQDFCHRSVREYDSIYIYEQEDDDETPDYEGDIIY